MGSPSPSCLPISSLDWALMAFCNLPAHPLLRQVQVSVTPMEGVDLKTWANLDPSEALFARCEQAQESAQPFIILC